MIYTKKVCGLQKNSAQEGKGGNKQMKKEKTTIVAAGILIGVKKAILIFLKNHKNMGF